MSCITPPFPSHEFGLLDLNTLPLKTLPAILPWRGFAITNRNTPTPNQQQRMLWLWRSHLTPITQNAIDDELIFRTIC